VLWSGLIKIKGSDVLTVRPKVADLQFSLFGRSLHPELFEVCRTQTLSRGDYEARIDITSVGHVITWRFGDALCLTEVATTASNPLPERRRLYRRRIKGKKHHTIEWRQGIQYEVSFQLEPAKPEVFWSIQQELIKDGRKGLLHVFQSSGRLALGALSYVYAETRNQKMVVQTFHTFPDDQAVVKIESAIRFPATVS
jgi:hypothetical protein